MPRSKAPRNPGRPRSGRPARREELEGFAEGLRYRLARLEDPDRGDLTAEFHVGEVALERGGLEEAERTFRAVAKRLDAREKEMELVEMPRGLVDYQPVGDRGVPPDRDEEPVSNRLLLVQRLAQVRRSEGFPVEHIVRRLAVAEEEYRLGHRARARAIADEVHRELDRMSEGPEGGAPPRG